MGATITWEVLAYFMTLYGTKIFSDLGAMVSNYNTLSDDKILHVDKWAVGVSKEAPELTGGVETGTTVMNLEYDSNNSQYIATQTGTLFTVKAPALVKGLLNALGVNVTTTNAVSEKIAAALSLAFDTSITVANMNDYSIPVLLKNGITYLSENVVKALSNTLYDEGFFSAGEVTYSIPETGNINLNSLTYGTILSIADVHNLLISLKPAFMNTGKSSIKYDQAVKSFNNFAVNYPSLFSGEVQFIRISCNSSTEVFVCIATFSTASEFANRFSAEQWFSKTTDNYGYFTNMQLSGIGYGMKCVNGVWNLSNLYPSAGIGINFNNDNYSTSNINARSIPSIDGIDMQDGSVIPASNDIDVQVNYPEWVNHAIDIGWYDSIVNALRNGRALPIDLNDALTIGEAGEFVIDQATAQTGVLDDTDTTAKTTAVQGATAVIPALVTVEGTRVDTTDIPDVVPEPTPPVVIPTGTTSAGLATIYNPTEAQVNALKGELWSQNIITTLQSIFLNNPMDAIISLNKVFCTPHTSGTATVKLGYVQTSVTGVKTVDDQYTTIDCGTVNVPEIYGNTTDYEPYTNVSVFLPFIGIQNLSAKDVVGGKLQIIYRVDVTTGTCIAQLFVTKDGVKQMLYSFEGNCAVEIPLSGSNANRAIIGLASIAASAVAPGAGLALAGGAMNLVNGVNLQRSGGFQSNAGAMNNKKPYLIINRVLPYDANGYNQIYGYPSNNRVLLNSVSGYTRVKDVHVEGINCTDYEKNMIEEQLKAGILL